MGSRVLAATALAALTFVGCGRGSARSPAELAVDPADGVITTAEFPKSRRGLSKHLGEQVDIVGTPAQGGLPLEPPGDSVTFYLVVGPKQAVIMVQGLTADIDPDGVGDRIRVRGVLGYLDIAGIPLISAESIEFVP